MFGQLLKFIILISLIITLNLQLIQTCPIYLTVALNGKNINDSFLEINWGPNCIDKPDWIGIFNEDPSISYAKPLDQLNNIKNLSGKYVTKMQIGELKFPIGWNKNDKDDRLVSYAKGKCLSYYVAGYQGINIMTMECLKIQPNWMGLSDNIGKLPLKDLFIPGTHSSGAYENAMITQSELVKYYGCSQNLDVWSQLVFGIRFLDFRIGYNDATNNYWIVNENIMISPLQSILKDIKRFVTLSREVVIVDFSSFPIGFKNRQDRHTKLLEMLINEFGDIAFKRTETNLKNSYELTMNDIRSLGKHLIITYPMDNLSCQDRECNIIWPSWKRFSIKNLNNSETLDFMRLLFSQKDLTHTVNKGWIFEATRGLEESYNSQNSVQTTRYRANNINTKISNYLGGPWSLAANVVTLDFFSSTNIVDIAIYSNTNKAFTYANIGFTNFDINNYNFN